MIKLDDKAVESVNVPLSQDEERALLKHLAIAIRRQKNLPLLREAIAHCGLRDKEEILLRWLDLRGCTWDHEAAEQLATYLGVEFGALFIVPIDTIEEAIAGKATLTAVPAE